MANKVKISLAGSTHTKVSHFSSIFFKVILLIQQRGFFFQYSKGSRFVLGKLANIAKLTLLKIHFLLLWDSLSVSSRLCMPEFENFDLKQ